MQMKNKTLQTILFSTVGLAAVALIRPIPIVILYAAIWGFLTALARPFSGVTEIWDFVERWANWGVPLALLHVRGIPRTWSEWFR